MCKLFAMTNMESVTVNKLFINTIRNAVCALSDKDGFGFAVLDKNNSIKGEKTITPFNYRPLNVDPKDRRVYKSGLIEESESHFGSGSYKKAKAFIAHARLSTNTVCIENTHPFVNESFVMAHNGVVEDDSKVLKGMLRTNCDSEIIEKYWSIDGIDAVEQNVSGYYAFLILDKEGKMHVVRDARATLYLSYCRTVHSYIIATIPEIIITVAKKMQWAIEKPEKILDNTHIIFEGNTIEKNENINPIGFSGYSYNANRALGYEDFSGYRADGSVYSETDPDRVVSPSYRELFKDTPADDEPVDTYLKRIK